MQQLQHPAAPTRSSSLRFLDAEPEQKLSNEAQRFLVKQMRVPRMIEEDVKGHLSMVTSTERVSGSSALFD